MSVFSRKSVLVGLSIALSIPAMVFCVPTTASANKAATPSVSGETSGEVDVKPAKMKSVSGATLKQWVDAKKEMQIVDARPKKFDKGDVIIGAKFLPYDADAAKIAKVLPSKDAVVVVYCANIKCPASTNLGNQLIQMGYKNVYRYPEGLKEWMDKGYPTGKAVK